MKETQILYNKPILKRRQLASIAPPGEINEDYIHSLGLDTDLIKILENPTSLPELKRYKIHDERLDELQFEISQFNNYREKPLSFWHNELGIHSFPWTNDLPPQDWDGSYYPLWSKQVEVIEALVKHRKVAVKSGHGVGKSFLAAGIILYLALIWRCIGLTTAPTFRQVRRILWSEIHYQYNHAKNFLGGKLNQVSLDLGDRWFVEGFATDNPSANITGIHEENVFVVVDEAGGVEPEIFEAMDSILISHNSFILYIGNPIEGSGPFYEAFQPGSPFHQISISCYDSPNVRHDKNIYPKLVTGDWVKDKEKRWKKGSALFASRVEGEFPTESTDTLIPLKKLQAALDRELSEDEIVSFGLDVARQGSDRSVYSVRYKSGKTKILETTNQEPTTETAGRMKAIYRAATDKGKDIFNIRVKTLEEKEEEEEKIPPVINVDSIGVGGGVADMLIEDDLPANEINVGESPDTKSDPENDIFLNKRAQYYYKLRQAFLDDKIAIDDDELIFELSKIKHEFLRSGKIKIIDKMKIKKEVGKSPDLAESVMLAWSVDPEDICRDLVRWL